MAEKIGLGMMPDYRFPVNMVKFKAGVAVSRCGFFGDAEIGDAVITLLVLDRDDLQAVFVTQREASGHV